MAESKSWVPVAVVGPGFYQRSDNEKLLPNGRPS